MNFDKTPSKMKFIFADDIMTQDVVVIKQETPISQVAHLMLEERVSGYPVVDDVGKVIGIVTVTDLFQIIDSVVKSSKAYLTKYEDQAVEVAVDEIKVKPVSSIMSTNVVSVLPETPLVEILQKITELDIHTFPVMKEGRLIGIVSRRDVLNATFRYG